MISTHLHGSMLNRLGKRVHYHSLVLQRGSGSKCSVDHPPVGVLRVVRRGRGRARGVRLEGEVAVPVDLVAVRRRRVRRPGAVRARGAVRAVRAVGVARGGAAVGGDAVDGGQAAVALGRAARDAVRRVHRDQRRRDRLDPREGVPATQTNGRCEQCHLSSYSAFMVAPKPKPRAAEGCDCRKYGADCNLNATRETGRAP